MTIDKEDKELLDDLRAEMFERQVEMLPVLKPKEGDKNDTEENGGKGSDNQMPELR